MLVVRFTVPVKAGGEKAFVEWIRSRSDYGIPHPPYGERVYWYKFAPWCEVIHEMEFENLTQYEAHREKQKAASGYRDWVSKVGEFYVRGGRSEVWNVEQFD